jgi:hypothetical protein
MHVNGFVSVGTIIEDSKSIFGEDIRHYSKNRFDLEDWLQVIDFREEMAHPEGFEPPTPRFVV